MRSSQSIIVARRQVDGESADVRVPQGVALEQGAGVFQLNETAMKFVVVHEQGTTWQAYRYALIQVSGNFGQFFR